MNWLLGLLNLCFVFAVTQDEAQWRSELIEAIQTSDVTLVSGYLSEGSNEGYSPNLYVCYSFCKQF